MLPQPAIFSGGKKRPVFVREKIRQGYETLDAYPPSKHIFPYITISITQSRRFEQSKRRDFL